jgi:hypothetical protein
LELLFGIAIHKSHKAILLAPFEQNFALNLPLNEPFYSGVLLDEIQRSGLEAEDTGQEADLSCISLI